MNSANTRPTVFLALVACGVVTLTIGSAAQRGGKVVKDTPVTSTLLDQGDVDVSSNYRIQSDEGGPYVTFSGTKNKVESIIQTSNVCCQDWELDTGGSITRSILVDFRDPVPGSDGGLDPVAPFAWAFVRGRLIAQCHLVYGASFPGMSMNQTLDCPLLIEFPIPGNSNTYWRVAMYPSLTDTDLARVECRAVDGFNKCNDWSIDPTATYEGVTKNVAKLQKVSYKGNTPPEDHGNFYMTFSIRVTNP